MSALARRWLEATYRSLAITFLAAALTFAAPVVSRAQNSAATTSADTPAASTQATAAGADGALASDNGQTVDSAAATSAEDPLQTQTDPTSATSQPSSSSASQQPQAESETPPDLNPLRDVPKTFFVDEGRLWTAPFQAHHYNGHVMIRYILPFTAITGTLIATDKNTSPHLPNSPGVIKWSNRIGTIGAPYTPFAIGLVTYLVGRKTHNRHAVETGVLSMEALAHAELIGLVIKEATQRERPDVLPLNNLGFWRGGTSFPSGHAIGAFAVANVFSREYHDHIAIPIVAYSLAGIIAFSRASGRDHWTSDLFAGAFGGILVGRWVYREHHDPTLPGSPGKQSALTHPDIAIGNGVQLAWHF